MGSLCLQEWGSGQRRTASKAELDVQQRKASGQEITTGVKCRELVRFGLQDGGGAGRRTSTSGTSRKCDQLWHAEEGHGG